MAPLENMPERLQEVLKESLPTAEFGSLVQIGIASEKDECDGKVSVVVPHFPFAELMVITEYLMHLTAQRSEAGYEKALDLLREGAMTYKTIKKPHGDQK